MASLIGQGRQSPVKRVTDSYRPFSVRFGRCRGHALSPGALVVMRNRPAVAALRAVTDGCECLAGVSYNMRDWRARLFSNYLDSVLAKPATP
jgi:hypothetical protein